MERLWKNEGATSRKRFDGFKPRNRLDKPNLVATACHRLPPKSHGKEGFTDRVRQRLEPGAYGVP